MATAKMHPNEVNPAVSLVRGLLREQFPQWADLPLVPVESAGTDNAIYRLGEDLAVRLPRIDWALGQADKERQWLPKLAPFLPLRVPDPLAAGEPALGYPWSWSVYRWLEGESLARAQNPDLCAAALSLAAFIRALQAADPAGGPPAAAFDLRGVPLSRRDRAVRAAIRALDGEIDTAAVLSAWEAALQAPDWEQDPVWFHGDLLPGNVLVHQGQVSAVIDFAGLGVGDPACDLMIAWGLFSGESRAVFRSALQVDEASWARGRGQALAQALIFIPYYLNSNPAGVAYARHVVSEVLKDQK